MSWTHWKRGLFAAMLAGILTGALGLFIGVTWQQALILLTASIAKDTLFWIKKNPIENVADTAFIRRKSQTLSIFLMALALAFLVGCTLGCTTVQSDITRIESDGTTVRSQQKCTSFFDSKSKLARMRASATDKTVGLTLADLDQEASGTNVVSGISEIVGAAVRAAVKP